MLIKSVGHQIEHFTKDAEEEWSGAYTFIHGADPQFGFIDLANGGTGNNWDEEIKLLRQAITTINTMKPLPRFFFICGDLVDAFPGVEPRNSKQTKDILTLLSECDVPVLVISGNHDIGNKPTNSSIKQYRDNFGDDYYSFFVGGVFYIALNSQYFFEPAELPEQGKEQMIWLDSQLQEAKSNKKIKHTVVFMHIPLFLLDPDEENKYFSIPKVPRLELLEKFGDAGVSVVFSGHYHRSAGGFWNKTKDGKTMQIESVVTSAIGMQLGDDKSGVSVVSVSEEKVSQEYYAMDDIPQTK